MDRYPFSMADLTPIVPKPPATPQPTPKLHQQIIDFLNEPDNWGRKMGFV